MGVTDLIGGYFLPPPVGGPPIAQAGQSPATPGGYSILDYVDSGGLVSPAAGADGKCTLQLTAADPGNVWLCDRYTVENTSTTATVAIVYLGDPSPQNLRDVTGSGNLDVADNNSPLIVPGTRYLTVVWQGCSVGAVGTFSLQYRLLG